MTILRLLDRTDVLAGDSLRWIRPPAVELRAAALASVGERLPFADASFDTAVAIHALEAVPDRSWALTELRRILRCDGRLVVAVWGRLEDNPALSALGDSLRRRGGVRAEAAVGWLSSLSEPDDLRALLAGTDFVHVHVTQQRGDVELATVSELRRWLLDRFPIGAAIRALPQKAREDVATDLLRTFARSSLGGPMHRIPYTRDVHTAVVRT
jgi:SAM-dependent methyltransferase